MHAKEATPLRMGSLGPRDSQPAAHTERKDGAVEVQRPPHPSASGSSPPLRVINPSHNSGPTFTSASYVQSLSQARLSVTVLETVRRGVCVSLSLGPLLLPS